jgi:hypothetical protein
VRTRFIDVEKDNALCKALQTGGRSEFSILPMNNDSL